VANNSVKRAAFRGRLPRALYAGDVSLDHIERDGNIIYVEGGLRDFHYLLSQLHQCVEDKGYDSLTLDMGKCTSAFQSSMLSVCAQVMAYRDAGIDINLIPPTEQRLYNLFHNTNWGYFLDPHTFDPSEFRGYSRIPATQYTTPDEQYNAVNKIVNVILGALPNLDRTNIESFEWAINEITDNVLVHAQSRVGGLVQVSTFSKNQKTVEFVVADAGLGIPQTLRAGRPSIASDTDALDNAIREGTTRDSKVGQGNGLYGTYRICSKSNGTFQIDSGHARLTYNTRNGLSISNRAIPYAGTLVIASIDFSDPKLLEDALSFGGRQYHPTSYVETHYEKYNDEPIAFPLIKECRAFGSRVSGRPLRQKLANILNIAKDSVVVVDFDGVPVMSSSFADEAFGKLFLQIGPVGFMQRVKFVNMADTVKALVDKAISQRLQYGSADIDV
jgi:anti-sigma regulatory factor (Ser/Thr protein kinase)